MTEITLPDSWYEVSLEQWMQLSSINDTGLEGAMKRISVLSGLEIGDIMRLDADSVSRLADQLQWVGEPIPETLEETTEFDGVKYSLHCDMSTLEIGCFIDIENLIEDGAIDNLHLILSCLYRRTDSPEYHGIDDSLAEKLLGWPITKANGASKFFFLLAQEYMSISQSYLLSRTSKSL